MKKLKTIGTVLLLAILASGLLFTVNASAATGDTVSCIHLGTSAPSSALIDEYSFESFENNGLQQMAKVTSIPMPYSAITVNSAVEVAQVGQYWLTWSNGFTGKVYSSSQENSRQLTMPDYCLGLILYVEPSIQRSFNITVSAAGMANSVTESPSGNNGAMGYALLSDSAYLSTVSIQANNYADGFAFGELYISYGVIVHYAEPDINGQVLSAFSEILGVDSSRLSYDISTPAGESQTYPNAGAYDLSFTIAPETPGGQATTHFAGKGLRIIKGDQTAPPAPVLTRTSSSVTAKTVTGCEYSLDNTNWQGGNVFSGLTPNTKYTVYMRYKATDNLNASPSSSADVTTIRNAPPAPVLTSTVNTITVTPVTGCEYSIDNTNWQDGNQFSGLITGAKYTVYMRYKATDTLDPSLSSSADVTPKGTQNAPSFPVLTSTVNTITVAPVTGCEYSLNNTNWQDGTFSPVSLPAPGTPYTCVIRPLAP